METVTIERVYIASVEQSNLLNAIAEKGVTQDVVAGFYCDCIVADSLAKKQGADGCDWKAINAAILAKWPKGLERVKAKAWKKLDAMRGQRS